MKNCPKCGAVLTQEILTPGEVKPLGEEREAFVVPMILKCAKLLIASCCCGYRTCEPITDARAKEIFETI